MGVSMAEPCLITAEYVQSAAMPALATSSPSDASWYAVQTTPRHEKKVSEELAAKDIHCFLPTLRHMRQWSDRKKVVIEPLFAGYVFVRIPTQSSDRVAILRTRGVVG